MAHNGAAEKLERFSSTSVNSTSKPEPPLDVRRLITRGTIIDA
ncbi:hypothetical protein ABT272_44760 [Streptomyces sp900105245]|uniref:Uncharacterized protein n=1 Tax=Streptomyces sp. 900105245 TaxID=3154379 RepID=A0ABV1UM37_9ACTN